MRLYSFKKTLTMEGSKGFSLKREEDNILVGIKEVKSIGLASKAPNCLEKLLWIFVGIFGLGWSVYFLSNQFLMWNDNPIIVKKVDVKLNEINYPAMTICSRSSTRYAIAERLGNHIDPENIPEDLISLLKRIKMCPLNCTLDPDEECFDGYKGNSGTVQNFKQYYSDRCGSFSTSKVKGCEVITLHCISFESLLKNIFLIYLTYLSPLQKFTKM